MKWIRYTIETTTSAEDFISSALADLGIEGVEIENMVPLTEAETAKMFIDFPPKLPEDDGSSRVSFYLEEDADRGDILPQVRRAVEDLRAFVDVGSGNITESVTEDEDWVNNWKEFFHPFVVEGEVPGRDILIKPTWESLDEGDSDKILIEIDPGMSFGTGRHETTQLCLGQLIKYVNEGDEVLDLGCGSGILSIAALKLGAGHVTGTDIDDDCLISTRSNFEVNHLKCEIDDLCLGNLTDDVKLQNKLCTQQCDIVVANILADVIISMAPIIPACMKAGGIFIASGIIDFKEDEVKKAIEDVGLTILEIKHLGEWVGITARR